MFALVFSEKLVLVDMAEKGGYEVETFEAVGRKYKCHICMLIIRDPVQLAECGHRFCKLCIYSLVKE